MKPYVNRKKSNFSLQFGGHARDEHACMPRRISLSHRMERARVRASVSIRAHQWLIFLVVLCCLESRLRKLRNLHQFPAFRSRLMRHYPTHGHVQRLRDVHQRSAIFKNRSDELIHQVSVRAAMASWRHTGRQRWPFRFGQVFFQSLVFAIERPFLSRTRPISPPAPGESQLTAMRAGPPSLVRNSAISVAEPIFVPIIRCLQVRDTAGNSHARNLREPPAADSNIVRIRMSRIPLRRKPDSPFLVRRQWLRHVMIILALRINQFPKPSCLIICRIAYRSS